MIRRRLNALRRDGLSTQVYLVALAIALIGPGLLFTAVLLGRYASLERVRFQQDARESVRGIALSVDRDMAGLVSVLQTLAASPRLRQEGFGHHGLAGFETQAQAVTEATGFRLSLRRPDGTQLVNTALPHGAPLPQDPHPEDAAVLATKRPVVGDVRAGAPGRAPTYDVAVPVMVGGVPAYVLSLTVPVARLHQILVQDLAPGWTTAIIDRKGLLLARSEDQDSLAGQPMQASLRGSPTGAPDIWEGSTAASGRSSTSRPPRRRRAGPSAPASPSSRSRRRCATGSWPSGVRAPGAGGVLRPGGEAVGAGRRAAAPARPGRRRARRRPAGAAGLDADPRDPPARRRAGRRLAEPAPAHRRARPGARAAEPQPRGLRESEARFRHMADSAPALIWMTDEAGEIVFANLHYDYLFGRATGR